MTFVRDIFNWCGFIYTYLDSVLRDEAQEDEEDTSSGYIFLWFFWNWFIDSMTIMHIWLQGVVSLNTTLKTKNKRLLLHP